MTFLLLASAISLSAISAYYSIVGLMAIFSAAKVPIAIMGSCLEFAKIVLAFWLKLNWKTTPGLLKTYFVSSILVLMLITSAGIFGFLSRAHSDQGLEVSNVAIKLQEIDRQIAIEKRNIDDATKVIAQLDQAVQSLLEANRVRGSNGSIAVRKSQNEERQALSNTIATANANIGKLQEERIPLLKQQTSLEAEVGPIKYVASLFYDTTDKAMLEKAVIFLILMFVFTFDPLAILMFVAVAHSLKKEPPAQKEITQPTPEVVHEEKKEPIFEKTMHVKTIEDVFESKDELVITPSKQAKQMNNSKTMGVHTVIKVEDSIEIKKN